MSDLDWRSHPGVRQSKLCYPLRIPVFHAEVTVIIGLKRTQSGNIHSTELSDSETVDGLRYARGPVLKPNRYIYCQNVVWLLQGCQALLESRDLTSYQQTLLFAMQLFDQLF